MGIKQQKRELGGMDKEKKDKEIRKEEMKWIRIVSNNTKPNNVTRRDAAMKEKEKVENEKQKEEKITGSTLEPERKAYHISLCKHFSLLHHQIDSFYRSLQHNLRYDNHRSFELSIL